MEKIPVFDRILLLLTGLLAAYQIAIGIDNLSEVPIIAFTVGFGILLIASLLILVLGFEVLDLPIVVILSSAIPFSLSLGLVWEYLATFRVVYLIFILLGFMIIMATRIYSIENNLPLIVLALFHGVAGLVIFLLPEILVFRGEVRPIFSLVSLGGALIGIGGLLLVMLRAGKPPLPRQTILKTLPVFLCMMAAAFVLGFSAL